MRCINIGTRGFVPAPPRRPSPLEPHIDFTFKERLQEELLLRDPPQPFPAEPLNRSCPLLRLRDMLTPKARPPVRLNQGVQEREAPGSLQSASSKPTALSPTPRSSNRNRRVLKHDAEALYPSDASLFSAASIEFGGPPTRTATGSVDRYEAAPGASSVLWGSMRSLYGGQIIFWDLGLVIAFPAGSTILLPLGCFVIRLLRSGRRAAVIPSFNGPEGGITRWIQNGHRSDVSFAVKATKAEHDQREVLRARAATQTHGQHSQITLTSWIVA
ncbi:hypothetical protein C8R43DRAFT_1128673 [Mycena crocata]|nr:hypothetical protein C8R43DRAFT_1128673 [Mycena crocata]